MYAQYLLCLLQAGLVAYLVALEGDKHPHEILARIKELSPDGILLDIRKS